MSLQLVKLWYALGFCLLLLAAILSLVPLGADIGVGDKPSHLLAYFLLSGWFCLLARNWSVAALSIVALFAYGLLLEWLQSLTGYRYAEWADAVANGTGCLLGAIGQLAPLRRRFARVDAAIYALLR